MKTTLERPSGEKVEAEILECKPVSPEINFYELSGGQMLAQKCKPNLVLYFPEKGDCWVWRDIGQLFDTNKTRDDMAAQLDRAFAQSTANRTLENVLDNNITEEFWLDYDRPRKWKTPGAYAFI